ncbi:MAG TPA: BBE domain-containing protein, partial [Flavobacteriales bacterium]|nr:BBE domain-containing protein [Flavobacteriales bacterium]
DAAVDDAIHLMDDLPSPHSEVLIALLGGEVMRKPTDATAYPHRNAQFVLNLHGRWERSDEDERGIAWARASNARMAAHSTGGVYVNFMTQDEQERLKAAYGAGWERLVALKRTWDPHNLFRTNQNIR